MTAGLRFALEQKIAQLEERGEGGEPHLFLTLSLEDLKEMLVAHPPSSDLTVPPGQVYTALIDDLEFGNCPGSRLHHGASNELTLQVHTDANVTAWLKACERDGLGNEPVA